MNAANDWGGWRLDSPSGRSWTVNAERSMHHMTRAKRVRAVREEFAWLAKLSGRPRCEAVTVDVWPLAKDRRWLQDVAGCAPTAKAAIDGLVDAGVIDDDDETHLLWVRFHPTLICKLDGIRLEVTPICTAR